MLPSKYQTLRCTCTIEAVRLKNAPSTLQLLTQTINSQPEGMPGFSFQKFVPLNRYAWVGNVIFHKAVWYHAQEQLTVGSPTPLHKLHLWEQKGADLEIHVDRQNNIMSIDFFIEDCCPASVHVWKSKTKNTSRFLLPNLIGTAWEILWWYECVWMASLRGHNSCWLLSWPAYFFFHSFMNNWICWHMLLWWMNSLMIAS